MSLTFMDFLSVFSITFFFYVGTSGFFILRSFLELSINSGSSHIELG